MAFKFAKILLLSVSFFVVWGTKSAWSKDQTLCQLILDAVSDGKTTSLNNEILKLWNRDEGLDQIYANIDEFRKAELIVSRFSPEQELFYSIEHLSEDNDPRDIQLLLRILFVLKQETYSPETTPQSFKNRSEIKHSMDFISLIADHNRSHRGILFQKLSIWLEAKTALWKELSPAKQLETLTATRRLALTVFVMHNIDLGIPGLIKIYEALNDFLSKDFLKSPYDDYYGRTSLGTLWSLINRESGKPNAQAIVFVLEKIRDLSQKTENKSKSEFAKNWLKSFFDRDLKKIQPDPVLNAMGMQDVQFLEEFYRIQLKLKN